MSLTVLASRRSPVVVLSEAKDLDARPALLPRGAEMLRFAQHDISGALPKSLHGDPGAGAAR